MVVVESSMLLDAIITPMRCELRLIGIITWGLHLLSYFRNIKT